MGSLKNIQKEDTCEADLTALDVRDAASVKPDGEDGDMLELFRQKVYRIAEKYADMVEVLLVQKCNIATDEPVNDSLQSINEGIRLLNHIANTIERIDRLQIEAANGLRGNKRADINERGDDMYE